MRTNALKSRYVTDSPEPSTKNSDRPERRFDDPESLLPQDDIDRVTALLEGDTLTTGEQMKYRLELLSLNQVDDSKLVAGFVKSAPQFLAKNNIGLDAGCEVFADCGVPQNVLDQLITVPAKSKGGRTTVDDVVKTISVWASTRNTFTKQDVIDLTGASPGTTNKALTAAVKAGTITDHGGNPKQYQPKK